jgi:hypothetical protein
VLALPVRPDFCNVASGWEKASSKRTSKSRRRIWLSACDNTFHSFEELNAWLAQRCRALWHELIHPQYNGLTVAEVLELERVEMMPMPTPSMAMSSARFASPAPA